MTKPIEVHLKIIAFILLSVIEVVAIYLLINYLSLKFLWIELVFNFIGLIISIYIANTKIAPEYKPLLIILLLTVSVFSVIPVSFFIFGKKEGENFISEYNAKNIKYYGSGEEFFIELINDLKSAEKFIFLQFYIVKKGKMFNEITALLNEKAKSGVKVKLAYDEFGSFSLPKSKLKELALSGVELFPVSKINPLTLLKLNCRNHRKIIVIDGKKGYLCGINLGDEYINHKRRFGYWKDTALSFEGEIINGLTKLFYSSINQKAKDGYFIGEGGDIKTQLLANGFDVTYSVYQEKFLSEIYKAKSEIIILTPYFIPSNKIFEGLKYLSQNGVKIKLFLPAIPDKKAVYKLTLYYAERLKKYGVKTYLYNNSFLHAKTTLIDGKTIIFGSNNMDMRSLFLHRECSVVFNNEKVYNEIAVELINEEKISLMKTKKNGVFIKILVYILRFFAPFL